jgi:hypothetical protein
MPEVYPLFYMAAFDLITIVGLSFAVSLVPTKYRGQEYGGNHFKRFLTFAILGPLIGYLAAAFTVCITLSFTSYPYGSGNPVEVVIAILRAVAFFAVGLLLLPFGLLLAYLARIVPAAITAFSISVWFKRFGTTSFFVPFSIALLMSIATSILMPGDLIWKAIEKPTIWPVFSIPVVTLTFLAHAYFCWRLDQWSATVLAT